MSVDSVRRWVRQADIGDGIKDGLTTAEESGPVQLRREKRRLEMENEILRRAAAYFAEGRPSIVTYLVRERQAWRQCRDQRAWSTSTRRAARAVGSGPGRRHDDIVQRNLTAERPDAIWLTDITACRHRRHAF
jgi:hypothetical protein